MDKSLHPFVDLDTLRFLSRGVVDSNGNGVFDAGDVIVGDKVAGIRGCSKDGCTYNYEAQSFTVTTADLIDDASFGKFLTRALCRRVKLFSDFYFHEAGKGWHEAAYLAVSEHTKETGDAGDNADECAAIFRVDSSEATSREVQTHDPIDRALYLGGEFLNGGNPYIQTDAQCRDVLRHLRFTFPDIEKSWPWWGHYEEFCFATETRFPVKK